MRKASTWKRSASIPTGIAPSAQLIKVQNETLVEFCAANPERFVAFATAALQHPDLAAEQVEYAVKKLGFRGVGVGGSVAGEELANPRFHPFWAKWSRAAGWAAAAF